MFAGTHAVPLLKPPINTDFIGLAQRAGPGAKLFSAGTTKELITPHVSRVWGLNVRDRRHGSRPTNALPSAQHQLNFAFLSNLLRSPSSLTI